MGGHHGEGGFLGGRHPSAGAVGIPAEALLLSCHAALRGLLITRCAAPLSGHLLGIGAGNTEGFTAGSIAFLVLNAFLIILGKSQNHVGCLLRGVRGQIMNPPVVAPRWRCSVREAQLCLPL